MSSAVPLLWNSGAGTGGQDTGLARSAAGVLKVTDGSTGHGGLRGSSFGNSTTGNLPIEVDTHTSAVVIRRADNTAFNLEIRPSLNGAVSNPYILGHADVWVGPSMTLNGPLILRNDVAQDVGINRSAAGVLKVTDGSTGLGSAVASTVKVGGTTSSFPMLKNNSSNIEVRKADDSDWGQVKASGFEAIAEGTSNRLFNAYVTSPYIGVGMASGVPFGWSSSATDSGTLDTKMVRVAAGQVGIGNATNGQLTNLKTSATTVNLTGATTTATGLFPAKCIQLGVTVRVTTLVASGDGGTSMNIGDGSDADRYGATIAFAAGTTVNLTDATADPRGWAAAAGDVVFTCVGGTFNAGVVRVVAHYIDLTAPTS